jgi:hypothetical protein
MTSLIATSNATKDVIKILINNDSNLKDLTSIVERDEHQYVGGGSFGDVYRGIWKVASIAEQQPDVVVKVLRVTGSIDNKTLKVKLYLTSWCCSPDS